MSLENYNEISGMVPGASFVFDPEALRVMADNVLIRVDMGEAIRKSGLIVPEQARKRETPMYGTVLRVGSGAKCDRGAFIPMMVKVGDRVVFTRYGGHEVNSDDGTEYRIISQFNIWARIKNGKLVPQGNRMMARISKDSKTTDWGFVFPTATSDERDMIMAEIIRSGPGTIEDSTGVLTPNESKPKDTVLMLRHAGMELEENGKRYQFVGPNDVKAVVLE